MSQPTNHNTPSHQAMASSDRSASDATVAGDAARDALRYRKLLEAGAGLIWQADPDGRIRAVPVGGHIDPAALTRMEGHGWLTLIHPDDRYRFLLQACRARRAGRAFEGSWRISSLPDGWRWHRIRVVPLKDRQDRIDEWVGKASDDHERHVAEGQIAGSEARLRLALSAARMVAWEYVPEAGKSSRTENSWTILGIAPDDFDGYIANMHPDDRAVFHAAYVKGGSMRVPELRYRHPDGRMLWLSSRGLERRDADGRRRIIGVTYDITDRKAAEEEAWRAANHDALTGLPNRACFLASLHQNVENNQDDGGGVALALLDYLDFKALDAALGHEGADALLRRTGVRLREKLGRDDVVARIGGDEFGVFLADAENAEEAIGVAQALAEALAEDIYQADHILAARVCVGLTWSARNAFEGETLFRQAQIALHAAKQAARRGGAPLQLFDQELAQGGARRAGMAAQIARALDAREIIPYYQPKIDLDSGLVCGFEALARWRHPERGVLTPAVFGSAFDMPELARDIGREMARQVLDDLRDWIDAGMAAGPVALNLAAADFGEGGLAWTLPDMLAERGVPARYCAVEVTERVFLGEGGGAVAGALIYLDRAGIRIALDDFGTGYASLVHLKQFPVSEIKIDRSFIRNLETDAEDAAIVAALLSLARALSLDVTAEGVETEAQATFLRDHHCELAQGFLFGKPMDRDSASVLLTRQAVDRSVSSRRRRVIDADPSDTVQQLLAGQG
ncbi:MAG: putative bifunctional diguanylate cyclase/phosphodiesterase [Salinarimonas sp.]